MSNVFSFPPKSIKQSLAMISLCKEPFFCCIDLTALNLFIFKKKSLERTGFVHDYKEYIIKCSKMKFKLFPVKR